MRVVGALLTLLAAAVLIAGQGVIPGDGSSWIPGPAKQPPSNSSPNGRSCGDGTLEPIDPRGRLSVRDCNILRQTIRFMPAQWSIFPQGDLYLMLESYGHCAFYIRRNDGNMIDPLSITNEDVSDFMTAAIGRFSDTREWMDPTMGQTDCGGPKGRGIVRWKLTLSV